MLGGHQENFLIAPNVVYKEHTAIPHMHVRSAEAGFLKKNSGGWKSE